MLNPFTFLKQHISPTYLGVDIGTTSIKAVEVKKGKDRLELTNYGILEASGYLAQENRALQASSLKLFEKEVVELLGALVKEMKPTTNQALASLPAFSAFTAVIDLPQMTPEELNQAMQFQIRQYIPLPLSEVQADWFTIGQVKDDKGFTRNQILLISFPKEQIAHYKEIFKAVGLELAVIELESLSLVRGLVGTDPTHTLIVDIGSRSTDIVFAQNGYLKFASQSDFAGASITQALATSLGISPIRAEQLKREKGIGGDTTQYELSTVMLPILDAILNEIRTAQFNYERQFPGVAKIERVILSGGGANLIGIDRYMSKELGLPIVKAAPFARIAYPSSIEPLVPELDTLLSVSLGLTL